MEQKQKTLINELKIKTGSIDSEIKTQEKTFENIRENHMKMYEAEFCFKLNSEEDLVRNTLGNAKNFLLNKLKKQDQKLQNLSQKNNY